MREFFVYDCRGLVVRTTNDKVVLAVAKQILKGIGYLSWYATDNGGGSHYTFSDFQLAFALAF